MREHWKVVGVKLGTIILVKLDAKKDETSSVVLKVGIKEAQGFLHNIGEIVELEKI